ncbi:hypothetical protein [Leptolyngbya sp. 7M]|uniref:hypothetical protein n=1 Tax=Leptolyngbya sp. 7M TaxID=2812896 RepID=UPI001B8C7A82|nr:hypothetical protein [Leptolyngbya sp. 7M]QYO65925.1 hypothetical protein JVX88_03755 [Leptolyngbya sp. 7M]
MIFRALILSLAALLIFVADAHSQRRDYMTDEEIELVRDAQDIDLRITLLTRMIDRRFNAIGIETGGWKPKEKELDKWGELPTTDRVRAFSDIRSILQKAADDIDDIAGRNEITQAQNKVEGKLFPKAVRALAAAAERYLPHLIKAETSAETMSERGNLQTAIELCEAIIESVAKLKSESRK